MLTVWLWFVGNTSTLPVLRSIFGGNAPVMLNIIFIKRSSKILKFKDKDGSSRKYFVSRNNAFSQEAVGIQYQIFLCNLWKYFYIIEL